MIDKGWVVIHQNTKTGEPELLKGRGFTALERLRGKSLRKSYGMLKLSGSDVTIESVVPDTFSLASESIKVRDPRYFVRTHSLRVWGRIRKSDEPYILAKVKMHLVNADGAVRIGGFGLGEVLASHKGAKSFVDAICNHDEDGEPCSNIYELTEILDLPEAAGPHLMLIENIHLSPLVGKIELIPRLLKKLSIHYAPGGGVALMQSKGNGVVSKMGGKPLVFLGPKASSEETGLDEHPYDKGFQVGDLGKIATSD